MSLETMTFTIRGESAMLQHDVRLSCELNPYARKLAALSKEKKSLKKKGSEEAYLACLEEMARTEWEGGIYYNEKLGVHVPWRNIRKCLIEAARLTREGKKVERGVNATKAGFSIKYSGPTDLDAMWSDGRFIDQRQVKIGMSMITRTRPCFEKWECQVEIFFESSLVDRQDLIEWIDKAGRFIGIGDGRSLGFGRFALIAVDGKSVVREAA
jgi:hypothetical protein